MIILCKQLHYETQCLLFLVSGQNVLFYNCNMSKVKKKNISIFLFEVYFCNLDDKILKFAHFHGRFNAE